LVPNEVIATMTESSSSARIPKVIAFHLPQFHCIPENDQWWGEGFTEWTNVVKASPRYPGHLLPSAPLDRHYYNLLDPDVREWQAQLARRYGVEGFCYYHYWFKGKLLLEQPCEAILSSGRPDFPFCFSWANETWTRSWDGSKRSVLIKQDYGTESDWRAHFSYLLPFFKDQRYIRHENKPIFLMYRPGDFANVDQMMMLWDRLSREAGLPGMYFVKTLTCFDHRPPRPPYSAGVSFEPWLTERHYSRFFGRLAKLARRGIYHAAQWLGLDWTFVFSYDVIWKDILRRRYGRDDFPGAFVGWDNTPRMGSRSRIVAGSTPEKFGTYMRRLLRIASQDEAPFVFVNAWNEWAEGAYLEPDERHGYAYLQELCGAINHCKAIHSMDDPKDFLSSSEKRTRRRSA
jgi:lipopolysaccharide biosynthesis protein